MGNTFKNKFTDCYTESASYALGYKKHTHEVILKYKKWIEGNTELPKVKVIDYKEKDLKTARKVISIQFKIRAKDGQIVECEIIFPPNFPKVPPIFSINDPTLECLTLVDEKSLIRLPTSKFEVKLWTLYFYTRPENLLADFVTKVKNSNRLTNPVSIMEIPTEFEDKLNNPTIIFPFDLNFEEIYRNGKYEDDYQKWMRNSSSALDKLRGEFYEVLIQKEEIKKIKKDFDENNKKITELNEYYVTKNKLFENHSRQLSNGQVDQLVSILQTEQETKCFELESQLAGIQDTIWFIQETCLEKPSISFEESLKTLDGLYKEEFIIAHKAKQINISRF